MAATQTIKMTGGSEIPVVGLGTWLMPPDDAYMSVMTAIKEGYRHIDTAQFYENEESVGRAIKDSMAAGTVKRSELFITTKIWGTRHRPESVKGALEASLQKLQLEYINLYLIHFPISMKEGDSLLPFDEQGRLQYTHVDYLDTWTAMQALVDLGIAKNIGVCNFNHEQIQRLLDANLKHKPVSLQIEMNLGLPNEDLIKFARSNGIVVTAYSLLGNPGRPAYSKYEGDIDLLKQDKVIALAEKYNKSPAQILLRWGLDKGCVVLSKTVNPRRVKENSQVFDFKLTDKDIESLRGFPFRRLMDLRGLGAAGEEYYPFVFDP